MAQLPFTQGIITSVHPPRWEVGSKTNNSKSLLIYLQQVLRTPSVLMKLASYQQVQQTVC